MHADLHRKLIYLDRDYIADFYEVTTGVSPSTTVTKNQSKKAGATIPVFSAEVSAQETRSYKVSTLEMLALTWDKLNAEPDIDSTKFAPGMTSRYGWFEGELSVYQAKSSTQRGGEVHVTAESEHFHIRQSPTSALSLITTPEYFLSGLGTLVKLQKTVLKEMSIPIRAYVRVMAAHDHFKQWIAIPLVLLERESNG
ncbi:hypothetical protein [Ferribacterium limneticum]|uniref:hypothetical protein n=1 Tax=Ferribacterium limneticum TaxID=76259 RepID=UPI001CFA8A3D|nr:hypothetical protein [Ferribacterium limneticum]UCV20580.1 hypothetical protein KI610_08465 [Ferribacterium limneticum]